MFESILTKVTNNQRLRYTPAKLSNSHYIKFSKDLQQGFDKEEKKQFPKIQFDHTANMSITDDSIEPDKLDELYLINYNDIVIGYVCITQSDFYKNMVGLNGLYITPQYRDKGFGTEAVSYMKQLVIEKGFDYFGVRFSGDKRRKFYERNGFTSKMSQVNIMEL